MKINNLFSKAIIIILLISAYQFKAIAQSQIITLDQNTHHYNLGTSLDILEDKNGAIQFNDLLKNDYSSQFIRSEVEVPKYGYTTSAYWIKFQVKNPLNVPKVMYLEIAYPHLDYIELYIPGINNDYEKRTAGYKYKFENRYILYRNFVFKINLNQGLSTFFIRIKSSSSVKFPVILQTPEYFSETTNSEYLVLGLYYGILLVMILYNLFVFFTVRDISYLYYIIYIIAFMLFTLSLNGLAFQYIWPESLWWAKVSTPFFIFLGIFTIGQFIRTFLDLKKLAPRSDKMVIVMMLICLTGMLLSVTAEYSLATRLAAVSTITAVFNYFIVGIFSALRGNRSARYFLIAWTLFLVGCTMLGLQYIGYLPSNFITQYSVQFGSAAEVILLSFALGDKINILKEENEAAQLRTIEIQKNATENLERKVAERTMELNKANEHLKELDKLKSNFFANISHEIRTPLTLILSPVESVLQGDYDGSIDSKFFENLQRNAIRLLKLINNLLDFSKIEAGRMNVKIQEIDVVTFIRNYLISIHSAAEPKGITMNFVSMSNEVPLLVDLEKLDKIIMNLFSNSLKFTDRGGFITITIRDDDKNCYIEFEDSGIGIPEEKLASVFDRFSQVDAGSTRKYEGTGIGLALVKEFVELHSGTLSVKSRFIDDSPRDHGTTFTLAFPKGKAHFENYENVQYVESTELEESVSDYRFFGMREMTDLKREYEDRQAMDDKHHKSDIDVLIVEDNPDMQNFFRFLLHKHYNIHIAANGEEGFKTAYELRPDLIVSDVMMPVMNGYEMTKKIKDDNRLKRTPVIMLTAKSDISSKIEGIEYGADDYLTKPFNSKELLTRIRMLLKTRNYETMIEKRNNEIEEELKIARLIQHRLLPQTIPDIPGYKFHPTYIPMDSVGGDFYDYKAHDKFIEIFITDVSGHGLVSAFISMIAKMAFDSVYIKNSCTHVLYQVNDILCNSIVNSNYMTTFFCMIDRESNIMKYSNAGHLSPIVYRKNTDEFYELTAKGKPLGWFTDLHLVEEQIQLKKGDRVLFYTDGITECMNASKQFFEDQIFKNFIRSNSGLEPDLFSDKLINELKTFCNRDKFTDDLCLLVLDVY
jgi:signal transduction histidine kinase/serine phosphatase RsbU (regulator of sigma subunit)